MPMNARWRVYMNYQEPGKPWETTYRDVDAPDNATARQTAMGMERSAHPAGTYVQHTQTLRLTP